MIKKSHVFLAVIVTLMILNLFIVATVSSQTNQNCEQCGMTVDATSQAHFKVVDSNGYSHYVECMMCALKLLTRYDTITITTYCDWNGPTSVITVNVSQRGASVTVNPPNALVIAGGGCTKNRIVCNQSAASALLANNGTSNYLAAIQKYVNGVNGTPVTVPINATIMTVAQAAIQFGGGTLSPSPSPSIPSTQSCESCGMDVAADTQAHFKIVDRDNKTRYACCIKCAIKILTKTDELNITTNCDWFGSIFPITIAVKDNLNTILVNPSTALLIDGSCSKNRVVYDQAAANALLANNGSSRYLIASQNTTIPSNATVMPLAQAVRTYGASSNPTPTPSPTPFTSPTNSPIPTISPTPTIQPSTTPDVTSTPIPTASPEITLKPESSSNPTATQSASPSPTATAPIAAITRQCEACGMDVTTESQTRYKITDGNGNVHYVECYMCALNLINDYDTLHIVTFCDWYGPNYIITVDSTNFGAIVNVNPTTAMFLRGGSCVTARAAYNQTAADALLTNGFSQYTSPEQKYVLPTSTNVKTVTAAISEWYAKPITTEPPTNLTFVIAAIVGVMVIVGSIVAYKKLRQK